MIKLNLTFAYVGTDFTRKYTFSDIAEEVVASIKTKIKAINASLAEGTSNGLNDFFLGSNGEKLEKIVAAQLVTTEIQELDISEEG